ncbi:KRI1-like family protein [Apiospora saccharicola]
MAAPHPSRKQLFDESDDESDGGVKLQVNKEYAARFEHNKKREERQRLEEKFKTRQTNGGAINDGASDEEDSSSDEDEDEDGFLATEDLDAQISATLQAIRNKDPRIYDGKSTFYKPIEETPEEAAASASTTKEKPVTLKDYHRQRILAGDTGADEAEEAAAPKTYVQEQADLKKSIRDEIQAQLHGADEDDEEDADFLKAKAGEAERVKREVNQQGVHHSRAAKVKPMTIDVEEADKNPELYLSNFMAARAWMAPGNNWKAFDSDEEEEDIVGKADEWEVAYNLRFEDPNKSNEVLRSYARDVAAAKSVRREEKTARQRQRDQEREQKEAEKRERREEKARLRKLKVEEAEKRLKQIKKAAGLSGKELKEEDWVKFLNDAWDNDKWEEEMQRTFGDQYYAEGEGADEGEGDSKKKIKKPKWDDDIDIKDLVPDFEEEELPKIDLDEDEGEAAGEEEMAEEEDDGPSSKRQKTTKDRKKEKLASQKEARKERAKLEALIDSKMDVDHEVLAGPSKKSKADMPAFSYRQTWAESYGMTARDILMADDAALNEFVGLKKLAHFRPDDKKAKDKKRLGKKARLRQWRKETFGPEAEHDGPVFSLGDGPQDGEGVKEESQPSNDVVEGGSKKRKRSKKKKGTTADEAEA